MKQIKQVVYCLNGETSSPDIPAWYFGRANAMCIIAWCLYDYDNLIIREYPTMLGARRAANAMQKKLNGTHWGAMDLT